MKRVEICIIGFVDGHPCLAHGLSQAELWRFRQ